MEHSVRQVVDLLVDGSRAIQHGRTVLERCAEPAVLRDVTEELARRYREAARLLVETRALIEERRRRDRDTSPTRWLAHVTGVHAGPEKEPWLDVVPHGTQQARRLAIPGGACERVRVGDLVALTADGQELIGVVDGGDRSRPGKIGEFLRHVDAARILVSCEGQIHVAMRAAGLRPDELHAADLVRWDPLSGIAFEKVAGRAAPDCLEIVENTPDRLANLAGLPGELPRIAWQMGEEARGSALLESYALRIGGVLFTGPAGVGKTSAARALAGELSASSPTGRAFLVLPRTGFVLSKYHGETEERLEMASEILADLRRDGSPVVFVLDEADALLRQRGRPGNEIADRVATSLMTVVDRALAAGVKVVLATNRTDLVDAAAVRPGRIDAIVRFGRPGLHATAAILDRHLPAATPLRAGRSDIVRGAAEALHDPFASPVCQIHLQGGVTRAFCLRDFVTGAVLAAAVRRALWQAAYGHATAGGAAEIGVAEIVGAVEGIVAERVASLSPGNAAAHLDLLPGERVASVERREEKKGAGAEWLQN
ncbi:MAG: AAA family ATPase [Planctomycetes bacterium]|nr:AAA family ATPase [Planctomycetota bacterium]